MEQSEITKLKTFVRIRPIGSECNEREKVIKLEGDSGRRICVFHVDKSESYRYDRIFGESADQEQLHELLPDMVNSFIDGRNVCLFAYGQTGSGKTYSIIGADNNPGLLPAFCTSLHSELDTMLRDGLVAVDIASFEVYKEKVYDLFASNRVEMRIRGTEQAYVENLNFVRVQSVSDFYECIRLGMKNRSTAATLNNELSSRSHAIFHIKLRQQKAEIDMIQNKTILVELESNAFFVDLAGSERIDSGADSKESTSINQSLLVLQRVIKQRARGEGFVSVRESVLTRLLKQCFSDDARTYLLATISPLPEALPFTIKTLQFAESASRIKQAAKRHYRVLDNVGEDQKKNLADQPGRNLGLPLTDVSNFLYSRKLWDQWNTELAQKIPEDLKIGMDVDNGQWSTFDLDNGLDDLESLQRIREFFNNKMARQKGLAEMVEENCKLFEGKLKQRLCQADLDQQTVKDLKKEVKQLRREDSSKAAQMRQLQRENNALRVRLHNYENSKENERHRQEGQRYLDQERMAALESDRRTLHKVAELFESPIPSQSNVAILRRHFGNN